MYVYLVIYSIILSVLSLDKAYRNEDRSKTKYIYIQLEHLLYYTYDFHKSKQILTLYLWLSRFLLSWLRWTTCLN